MDGRLVAFEPSGSGHQEHTREQSDGKLDPIMFVKLKFRQKVAQGHAEELFRQRRRANWP